MDFKGKKGSLKDFKGKKGSLKGFQKGALGRCFRTLERVRPLRRAPREERERERERKRSHVPIPSPP